MAQLTLFHLFVTTHKSAAILQEKWLALVSTMEASVKG